MGLFLPLPGGVFSRPGLGPAADLPFFDSSKKGRPKKDDPDARDPFAALRGNLRRGARGGRRGNHFSPRATFKQSPRGRTPSRPVPLPGRPAAPLPFFGAKKKGRKKKGRPAAPPPLPGAGGHPGRAPGGVPPKTPLPAPPYIKTTRGSQTGGPPCPGAGLPPRGRPDAGAG